MRTFARGLDIFYFAHSVDPQNYKKIFCRDNKKTVYETHVKKDKYLKILNLKILLGREFFSFIGLLTASNI